MFNSFMRAVYSIVENIKDFFAQLYDFFFPKETTSANFKQAQPKFIPEIIIANPLKKEMSASMRDEIIAIKKPEQIEQTGLTKKIINQEIKNSNTPENNNSTLTTIPTSNTSLQSNHESPIITKSCNPVMANTGILPPKMLTQYRSRYSQLPKRLYDLIERAKNKVILSNKRRL